MRFSVGSIVIHASHGLGEVIQIEKQLVNGALTAYYVVKTATLTVWVPIEDDLECKNLRVPMDSAEFENLLQILSTPAEPLPDERKERKSYLLQQLTNGSIASVCQLIRDLLGYSRQKKLSDDDRSILERAKNTLLTEWATSFSIPMAAARKLMGERLPDIG
jgi:RNA polymerase-interacting CarD/CdnL/TRCF family regulator